MRRIEEQFGKIGEKSTIFTYEDIMAIKIQRAWKQYKTRKLLKNVGFCRSQDNVFNIIDDIFTDEEGN